MTHIHARLMALVLIPACVASCGLLVSFDEYELDTRSPAERTSWTT